MYTISPYTFRVVDTKIRQHNKSIYHRAFTHYYNQLDIGVLDPDTMSIKLEGQDWRCMYCDRQLTKDSLSLDHEIPLYRGGAHYTYNVHWVCPSCNTSKNSADLRRFCDKHNLDFDLIKQRIADVHDKLDRIERELDCPIVGTRG